ncbi:MAG: glutaminase [Proteobacteria bacterium]|nr:MAG: glutaminase [Pseudomonadota bacterium]
MDYSQTIAHIHQQLLLEKNHGQVAGYIPELATVDSEKFGVCLINTDNVCFWAGDWQEQFSIQSIIKVVTLSLAYQKLDAQLWQRVGVEPSGTPFNNLSRLEHDYGIPRNPFSNAGAIVVCDVLMELFSDPREVVITMLRTLASDEAIHFSQAIAASEKSEGYRNMALAYFMKSMGNIMHDVEDVLDLYFDVCSIAVNCEQLARIFIYLAKHGRSADDRHSYLSRAQAKRINAIMLTCGFYDEAGDFAFRVGLPGKSGVGGGIVAVMPGEFSLAVWSPRLNEKGNSYRGLRFLEQFTSMTEKTIF